jgi:hypothetical protein
MTTTRRNLFKFAGGAAVGSIFTPAPWKLITDAAIWSENWPGIPRPARGEIRTRFTNCSLCTAGCAMRARCVGSQPVSLAGVKQHPLSQGALCAWGVAAHHLPYHPRRLRQGAVEQAGAAVSKAAGAGQRIAMLDLRPGRAASWTYRRAMAQVANGVYIAPLQPAFAMDLSAARTVVSFGAPLMDRWGTPGNVFAARRNFRLIQVEPLETRTAAMADEWLPVRAGSEAALAAALGGEMPVDEAAKRTGLDASKIADLLKQVQQHGPTLVLANDLASPVMALNNQLAAPLVSRKEAPVPEAWKKAAPVTELAAVGEGSLDVLLIDESVMGEHIPWTAIEPKLAKDALVVVFGWTKDGYGKHARYTLPAPIFPEAADEVPAAIDTVTAVFRISTPLVAPPAGIVNPAEFVAKAAGLEAGDPLRERADAIQKTGRGVLFNYADAQSTPVKAVKPDDFWKALNEGGCWMDNAAPSKAAALTAVAQTADAELTLEIVTAETPVAPLASPLIGKMYRESNLRQPVNRIVLSQFDADRARVRDGGAAVLETASGRFAVIAAIDPGAPPGAVLVGLPNLSGRGKVVAA